MDTNENYGERQDRGQIADRPWSRTDTIERLALGTDRADEFIGKFVQMYGEAGQRVRNLLEEKQFDAAAVLLHKIRGTASALAADRLAKTARVLEQGLKCPEATYSEAELTLFSAELSATLQAMRGTTENR